MNYTINDFQVELENLVNSYINAFKDCEMGNLELFLSYHRSARADIYLSGNSAHTTLKIETLKSLHSSIQKGWDAIVSDIPFLQNERYGLDITVFHDDYDIEITYNAELLCKIEKSGTYTLPWILSTLSPLSHSTYFARIGSVPLMAANAEEAQIAHTIFKNPQNLFKKDKLEPITIQIKTKKSKLLDIRRKIQEKIEHGPLFQKKL